jgi:hypothetical protein
MSGDGAVAEDALPDAASSSGEKGNTKVKKEYITKTRTLMDRSAHEWLEAKHDAYLSLEPDKKLAPRSWFKDMLREGIEKHFFKGTQTHEGLRSHIRNVLLKNHVAAECDVADAGAHRKNVATACYIADEGVHLQNHVAAECDVADEGVHVS